MSHQRSILPRQESFASLHILTRRASEGSEALPSLARRVRMSFFGARVIAAVAVARCSWLALLDRWLETRVHITWPNNTLSHLRSAENVRPALRDASVQLNMTRGGFAITKSGELVQAYATQYDHDLGRCPLRSRSGALATNCTEYLTKSIRLNSAEFSFRRFGGGSRAARRVKFPPANRS